MPIKRRCSNCHEFSGHINKNGLCNDCNDWLEDLPVDRMPRERHNIARRIREARVRNAG